MKRSLKIVLPLALAVVLVIGLSGLVAATPPEKPLPQNIQPVIFMSGTDYEMGYQYGEQAAAKIAATRDYHLADRLGTSASDTIEKRDYMLKGFQYYIVQDAPELIDYMVGIADGCAAAGYDDISYADVLMISCQWDWSAYTNPDSYPENADEEELPPACSSCAAWGSTTTDGRLCATMSTDTKITWSETRVVYPSEEDSYAYIGDGESGDVNFNFAINEAGLMVGFTATPDKRLEDNAYGVTWDVATVHMARYFGNATDAKNWLVERQLCRGGNYIIADPTTAYIVETTAAIKRVREPGQFGENYDFIVNTNFTVHPDMCVTGGCRTYSVDRYEHLFNFLNDEKNQGCVDEEFVKMMYRLKPVLRSSNRSVHIGVVDDEGNVKAYQCMGQTYRDGTSSYVIEPTYSFYEVELKDSPQDVTGRAYRAARSYIGAAVTEMNSIDLNDHTQDNLPNLIRYAALNEVLVKAKAKYYEGWAIEDTARLTEGNESLYAWSEACSAYVEAQALAKHVYNELAGVALSDKDFQK